MLGRNEHDAVLNKRGVENSGNQLNEALDYDDELISGTYDMKKNMPNIKVNINLEPMEVKF
jgi:hypothetical protein